MEQWEKIVPNFKYNKSTPFFEILVPTVDTVRFGYLLDKLLSVGQSVLFTGNSGVGKVSWSLTHSSFESRILVIVPGILPNWLSSLSCDFLL